MPEDQEQEQEEQSSGFGFTKYIIIAGGVLAGLLLAIFLIGLSVAVFSNSPATASRIGMIRDVFIIMLVLEVILVILALVVLILQVARLIITLQNEIKPILTETKETVETAKGTAKFVSKNVAEPIIKTTSFVAGLTVFLREVGGIRRAIKRTEPKNKLDEGEHDE